MNSSKALSEFLRLLAHDLQNQIGAVDLNLQIMPTMVDEGDPTLQTLEPFITRAAMSASEMIETLSNLQTYAYSVADDSASSGASALALLGTVDLAQKARDTVLAVATKARFREVQIASDESLGGTDTATTLAHADDEALSRALKLITVDCLRGSFPGSTVRLHTGYSSEASPRPFIEIRTSQEGFFEAHRATLALFLAKEALRSSQAEFQYQQEESRSVLRLLFPVADSASERTR